MSVNTPSTFSVLQIDPASARKIIERLLYVLSPVPISDLQIIDETGSLAAKGGAYNDKRDVVVGGIRALLDVASDLAYGRVGESPVKLRKRLDADVPRLFLELRELATSHIELLQLGHKANEVFQQKRRAAFDAKRAEVQDIVGKIFIGTGASPLDRGREAAESTLLARHVADLSWQPAFLTFSSSLMRTDVLMATTGVIAGHALAHGSDIAWLMPEVTVFNVSPDGHTFPWTRG
jgi:hypothetical protein